MNNKEIASSFSLLTSLMELHGENTFRVRSYRNAYNALRKLDKPLVAYSQEELSAVPGLGKSTVAKVRELLITGKMAQLESYRAKTPQGVQELLQIRGLGAGKVKAMWKGLGVESPVELLYACNENRLIELTGFGLKSQADIRQKVRYFLESRDKWLYSAIEPVVNELLIALKKHAGVECEPVGEFARKCPVIHAVELWAQVGTADLTNVPDLRINADSGGRIECTYHENYPVVLYSGSSSAVDKFRAMGPDAFVAQFELQGDEASEEEIFDRNSQAYVIPEMRDLANPTMHESGSRVVELEDLEGILHNHSTFSDGLHDLRDMAEYVCDSGYAYFGISDHSKSAVYANGLNEQRVFEQFELIDSINNELAPFKVYKGIESDILSDGSLDYEREVLRQFDFIVSSIHSGLKMDEKKATLRLIRAIENPYTTILGHPTGRLLLSRSGYPIDHQKVIDACAANGVAIELNANPLRLDLDYQWIPYAMEKNVYIAINPDAHSKESIHNVKYGVYAACKGGLTASFCVNAMKLDEFEQWLGSK